LFNHNICGRINPRYLRVNREFDSNEIDENDFRSEKHDDPRISTLHAISTDSSDEPENALNSIQVNFEWNCLS
jgi:hypothetical protein